MASWTQTTGIALAALTLAGCSILRPAASGPATEARAAAAPERDANGMRIARYTTAGAPPVAQAQDPMSVIARISYPRQTIRNVGDAVHHTLLRTGWRLNESTLTGEARDVLVMPLPDSQRVVGPYEVRTILHVLLGNSWVWCEDPVRRTVTFMLRDGAGATCPTGATFSDSTAAAPAVPMAVQLPQVEEILNEGEN